MLGQGLITADGDHWRRQRRLIQPAFRAEHLGRWGELIRDEVRETMGAWRAGGVVDVSRGLMELSFRVGCRTVFGTENLDVNYMYETFNEVSEAALAESRRLVRLPFWVPTLNHLRYRRALAALEAPVAALLAERRGSGRQTVDLFGLLMGARDDGESGEGMTARQLRDEGMTFLFAGHETTGNALSWALHELSLHPDIQARLHEEVTPLSDIPTAEELDRAPYLRAVCDEVLRLHPPVWWLERQNLEPESFGDFEFAPGTRFAMSAHVVHRDPRWWDELLRFNPSRPPPRHESAYFPFAAGPRRCIGSQLALQEMGQTLGGLIQRFRVEPAQAVVEPDPVVTVRVKGGLRVRLTPRAASA